MPTLELELPTAQSARLVILDHAGRLLLFRYADEHRAPFWATAGGQLMPGEGFLDAARRELHEETGFTAQIGRLVRTREEVFSVARGGPTRWLEHYFLVEADGGRPDRTHWTDEEQATIRDFKWWSVAELKRTNETILPSWLPELLESVLAQGPATDGDRRNAAG